MKKLKHLFLLIISAATVTSCQKQPVANFSFDKDIYYAGDTIHLKDASTDAKKWKWTAPDGQTFTSKDLDYVIDSNDVGGDKTFQLEATSENGKKIDQISNPITISQRVFNSDYYEAQGFFVFHPIRKYSRAIGGNWEMIATDNPTSTNTLFYRIYLPGNSAPTLSGIYNLQSEYDHPLSSGQACITIFPTNLDETYQFYSVSGQISVSISTQGKVRVIFNNIVAKYVYFNSYTTISGDLTFY